MQFMGNAAARREDGADVAGVAGGQRYDRGGFLGSSCCAFAGKCNGQTFAIVDFSAGFVVMAAQEQAEMPVARVVEGGAMSKDVHIGEAFAVAAVAYLLQAGVRQYGQNFFYFN